MGTVRDPGPPGLTVGVARGCPWVCNTAPPPPGRAGPQAGRGVCPTPGLKGQGQWPPEPRGGAPGAAPLQCAAPPRCAALRQGAPPAGPHAPGGQGPRALPCRWPGSGAAPFQLTGLALLHPAGTAFPVPLGGSPRPLRSGSWLFSLFAPSLSGRLVAELPEDPLPVAKGVTSGPLAEPASSQPGADSWAGVTGT